jgi:mRNA interferase MazF
MTPLTTPYEFGDVVLVPFPFTDQTAAKRRPAVIVSSLEYQRELPDLLLMAVTSRAAQGFGELSIQRWRRRAFSSHPPSSRL